MIRAILLTMGTLLFGASASVHAAVFVNEIDYDQPGVDTTEFIELAGTTGTNLNGWTLQLMNGANDLPYSTIALPNFTFGDDTGTGWGFFVAGRPAVANNDFDFGADGSVQNGPSDGVQVIDSSSTTVHFVQYAPLTGFALTGPDDLAPAGLVDNNTVADTSIYKTGTGDSFGDFTWDNQSGSITPGALNPGETLTAVPEPVSVTLIMGAVIMCGRRHRSALSR